MTGQGTIHLTHHITRRARVTGDPWRCVVVAAILLTAGCNADHSAPPAPTVSESRSMVLDGHFPEIDGGPNLSDLEFAVRYFLATVAQDEPGLAVRMLSDRCRPLAGQELRDAVAHVASDADLDLASFTAQIDGFTASVTYATGEPGFTQEDERWVAEGGAWRIDGCHSTDQPHSTLNATHRLRMGQKAG